MIRGIEGFLTARTGGTRVSSTATTTPRPVLEAARHLADASTLVGTTLDDAIRTLRAIWPDEQLSSTQADRTSPDPPARPAAVVD